MLQRRTFLVSGLIAVAGVAGWRALDSSEEDAICLVIRKRLDYLNLDDTGLKAFSRDLVAKNMISGARLRAVSALGVLYTAVPFTGKNAFERSVRHGEERIASSYLLSSDFFVNGADSSRIVRYLGFYDPLHACGNPFARRIMD